MSVWVEMPFRTFSSQSLSVTLHVSVWVEILPRLPYQQRLSSRSTWACELKYFGEVGDAATTSHAPRERVSWNEIVGNVYDNPEVTLHVSVWVEILTRAISRKLKSVTLHVSVWVEMVSAVSGIWSVVSHAPRERVSWNDNPEQSELTFGVTLHVSVWVEMTNTLFAVIESRSRSTWACELKFAECVYPGWGRSHAPRERVSWNF